MKIICFRLQLQTTEIKQVMFSVKLHGHPIIMQCSYLLIHNITRKNLQEEKSWNPNIDNKKSISSPRNHILEAVTTKKEH